MQFIFHCDNDINLGRNESLAIAQFINLILSVDISMEFVAAGTDTVAISHICCTLNCYIRGMLINVQFVDRFEDDCRHFTAIIDNSFVHIVESYFFIRGI